MSSAWEKAVSMGETEGHGHAGAMCSPRPAGGQEGEKMAALALWRGTATSAIVT